MSIFERIGEIRKTSGMSQKDFAEQIEVPVRSLQNYESGKSENVPHPFIEKLIVNAGINANWLISGTGYKSSLDPILFPYFDILKTLCPEQELEQVESEIISDMVSIINARIANYLISDLLKQVSQIPTFEKIIRMIIMNDIGATVRIWSIIEQASRDDSEISSKEKLIKAAQKGFMLVLPSQSERDFLRKFVESWSEEMCDYLLQNSTPFINILKKISKKGGDAISSNEKILKFVRRFNKKI